VTDLDEATKFWEAVIGAEVVSRSETDAATEVTLRSPIGGGGVTLSRLHRDDSPIEMGHSIFRQYMNTSDSAGLYKRAVSLGYDATHDPFDVPGRVNVVKSYTRQPDGYLMDLCEFQGDPGKRILHGQVDAKEHTSGDDIATYIGPTAIYVTDMNKAVDFWTRLGGTVMDRVVMGDSMEITQMRGDAYGVVVQLMEITGQRGGGGRGGEAPERTAAVMPTAGTVDLGTGLLGFRVVTDDCRALHHAVVAGGYQSTQAPIEDGNGVSVKVLDSDGYSVEIRQRA
jgi:catechol 2,3-dioxygenase-like lactoylglutathione lyase family enzyme